MANISRSHVTGSNQVEQILEIFDIGAETNDKIDFNTFYTRVVEFMGRQEEDGLAEEKEEQLEDNVNLINYSREGLDTTDQVELQFTVTGQKCYLTMIFRVFSMRTFEGVL